MQAFIALIVITLTEKTTTYKKQITCVQYEAFLQDVVIIINDNDRWTMLFVYMLTGWDMNVKH